MRDLNDFISVIIGGGGKRGNLSRTPDLLGPQKTRKIILIPSTQYVVEEVGGVGCR